MNPETKPDTHTDSMAAYRDQACSVADIWQLPRGPNAGTSGAEVAAAHRARLHYAIVHCVADKGYSATTIGAIAAAAQVSRSAFYAQFKDKEHCFLSAYETAHLSLVQRMREELPQQANWEQRLQHSLRSYLQFKRDHPALAYTMLVEIHAAGINARQMRDWGHARFARMQQRLYEQRCKDAGIAPRLPGEIFLATVAGIEEIAARFVCEGRTDQILEAEPSAMYLLVSLYDNERQDRFFTIKDSIEP